MKHALTPPFRGSSFTVGRWPRPLRPKGAFSPEMRDEAFRTSFLLVCVAQVIDGRISAPEQVLRGGCRTDQTASDDAIGPEKRPPVLPKLAHETGASPIADL